MLTLLFLQVTGLLSGKVIGLEGLSLGLEV